MRKLTIYLISALLAFPTSATAAAPGRADLVELTLSAPVILRADIVSAKQISGKLAPGLAAGQKRHLVKARVANVLTAPGFVPREIEYLLDLDTDSRGRSPKLKALPVLLFLAPGGSEAQFRLVKPWANVAWTAEHEAYVRAIAAEAVVPEAKGMAITGLRQAFHVRGSLPGESESQIFADTRSENPIALVVLSRPGQERSLSVATGDIIDEAAAGVKPGSLLWYHLACGLPRELPDSSMETLEADDASAARDDYRFILDTLGPCDRSYGL